MLPTKDLQVVIFTPDSAVDLSQVLGRHSYSAHHAQDLAFLSTLTREQLLKLDAFIVPLNLESGQSGIAICMQLRSDPDFASIPILALSTSTDKAIIHSIYGGGADVVAVTPFDADHIFLQVAALSRQRRSFTEMLDYQQKSDTLSQPLQQAFDVIHQGIIIFDREKNLVFANESVFEIEGASTLSPSTGILNLVLPLLSKIDGKADTVKDFREFGTVQRSDNKTVEVDIRVLPLSLGDDGIAGYALELRPREAVKQLAGVLLQSERSRAVTLLSASAAVLLFEKNLPASVLSNLESRISSSTPVSDPDNLFMYLLEVLDLMLLPSLAIKVESGQNEKLAVRPADLFQIVGQMVLFGASQAAYRGECRIILQDKSENGRIPLLVATQSKPVPIINNDRDIKRLLDGEYEKLSGLENNKFVLGLASAQRVADRYNTEIEIGKRSAGLLKTRVYLPLASSS